LSLLTFNATLHKILRMHIILVGYMGSGKSVVGRKLAQSLNLPFIDLDTYIESKENRSIKSIFDNDGQIYFRKKEHLYLKELLTSNQRTVIATGGGAPCYAGNMDVMLKASQNVFYLKVSIGELVTRLFPEKEKRPLISHLSKEEMPEFFGKHLFERNPFYAQAKHTIICDSKSIEEIIEKIQRYLV